MKLTQEQIEKIEELLTARESGESSKNVSIRMGLDEVGSSVANFHVVMRAIGIDARKDTRGFVKIPASESASFQEFLAEKRRREANGASP